MLRNDRTPHSRADHPINHLKRHVVTCTNIEGASSANLEIVRVLLHMFRDIYVPENYATEDGSVTIMQIIFQVRSNTFLKIVHIELARRVDSDEYLFLFGSAWGVTPTTSDSTEMDIGAPGVAAEIPQCEIMSLYIDTASLKLALARVQAVASRTQSGVEDDLPSFKCYSHIVDAMAHAPRCRNANVFEMCVVEVQACHAQKIMQQSNAQFSRTNEEYAVVSAAHVAAKLFLDIELRGVVDAWTNYRFGPFPTLDHEAHDDTCRRHQAGLKRDHDTVLAD